MSLIQPDEQLKGLGALPRSDAENPYDLITDVIACIEQEPKRLNMGDWICRGYDLTIMLRRVNALKKKTITGPPCGTAACFGGWLVLLHDGQHIPGSIEVRAARLLDEISTQKGYDRDDEGEDAGRLTTEGQGLFSPHVIDKDGEPIRYGSRAYVQAVIKRIRKYQRVNAKALKAATLPPRRQPLDWNPNATSPTSQASTEEL
jgi:hypothetical protein